MSRLNIYDRFFTEDIDNLLREIKELERKVERKPSILSRFIPKWLKNEVSDSTDIKALILQKNKMISMLQHARIKVESYYKAGEKDPNFFKRAKRFPRATNDTGNIRSDREEYKRFRARLGIFRHSPFGPFPAPFHM